MLSYLKLADNFCSLLWDMGKFYNIGLDCSGRWCVFLYTKPSQPPKLVKQGLTARKLFLFFVRAYNAQVRQAL